MRCFKLLLMGGIVLALTVPAWAITWVNPLPAGTRVRFDILDWSMGKVYQPNAPLPIEGVGAVNAQPQNVVPGAMVINLPQVGLGGVGGVLVNQTEDIYGIVKVLSINADPGAMTYWAEAADPNSELAGIIYGGVDTYIGSNPQMQQVVSSAGLFMDLYEQPKGNFTENLGSAGRISFNQYEGVGFDAAGNPIPGAQLLLHLESTDDKAPLDATPLLDIDGDGDPDGDFTATFTPEGPPAPPGSGTGESSLFWDAVGGSWAPFYEVIPFYFPNLDPRFGSSMHGDFHSGQDFDPATLGPSDWITTSDDPTRGHFVPEPVTMAGLMLGVGSLLGYVRRRRR